MDRVWAFLGNSEQQAEEEEEEEEEEGQKDRIPMNTHNLWHQEPAPNELS